MSDALRTLKIKSGVVKRLTKDLSYSKTEIVTEQERLAKLKESGGDEYEIRAQDKVVADAEQMVPDYKKRLASAVQDLQEIIKTGDSSISETEDFSVAKQLVHDAEALL